MYDRDETNFQTQEEHLIHLVIPFGASHYFCCCCDVRTLKFGLKFYQTVFCYIVLLAH